MGEASIVAPVQYQEEQLYRSQHVGQDPETLQREMAGLESYIAQSGEAARRGEQEIVRLEREKLERLRSLADTADPAYRQILSSYDTAIDAVRRENLSRWQERNHVLDQIGVLKRVLAERETEQPSDTTPSAYSTPAPLRQLAGSATVADVTRDAATGPAGYARPRSGYGTPPDTGARGVSDVVPPSVARERPGRKAVSRPGASVLPPDVAGSASSLTGMWNALASAYDSVRDAHTKEFADVSAESARAVKKPRKARYLMYGSACVLMDLWGLAISALNLTVVAIIFTFIVNLVLLLFMWLFGRLLFGTEMKRLKKKREELGGRIQGVQGDIRALSAEAQRFRKYAYSVIRRSPQLAAKATQITKRAVWVTRKFKPAAEAANTIIAWLSKPGVTRSAEFLPFVQALPWWTIGIVAQYSIHDMEYRNAQRVLAGYQETKGEFIGMVDDHFAVQFGVVDTALSSATAAPARA